MRKHCVTLILFRETHKLFSQVAALVAENKFDEGFIASPALTGNNIILRSLTHLYCVEE